jgi:hypothetical protein
MAAVIYVGSGGSAFRWAPISAAELRRREEFEFIAANYAEGRSAPGRLIYTEIIDVDTALVSV